MTVAIVDAGPLFAAADAADPHHERSLQALSRSDLQLVIPAFVVADAIYLVGRRMGAGAEAEFLRGLEPFDVEVPDAEDWARIGDLVEQYADLPLGGTDASLIALAERTDARTVVTLDRRHFTVVRPRHCEAFELLPE